MTPNYSAEIERGLDRNDRDARREEKGDDRERRIPF